MPLSEAKGMVIRMKNKLDSEEKKILDDYEKDEFVEIPEMGSQIKRHISMQKRHSEKIKG